MKRDTWQEKKESIKEIFLNKSRDEWCELMEGTDVCFAPVLDMTELHYILITKLRDLYRNVELPNLHEMLKIFEN